MLPAAEVTAIGLEFGTLPAMDVEASQGAHFFHNLSAFEVSYLTVPHTVTPGIDWAWLDGLPAVAEPGERG